jgi:endonuclease III
MKTNHLISPPPSLSTRQKPSINYLKKKTERRARILREGQLTMIVYGADEALLWAKRVFSFQAALRGTLGDRRRNFSWYGSVLDSVVGVFLTQNVADHLSSRAYMEIVSRWPAMDPPPSSSTTPFQRRDTVDWEAIRTAPPEHLADAIRCRGLMNFLTSKIQAALNVIRARNIHRMHGKWASEKEEESVRGVMEHMIDAVALRGGGGGVESRYQALSFHPTELLSLEWLRDVDDASAYRFFSSIDGLGAKSCACLMLLTLNRKEFPVDTNVGRIAARLGWLPLDASQAIEDLDDYAPEQEVHKYLKSRLLGFGFTTLYEMHYQMITLGKVFCSKANPNCSSCPMATDCEYALNNGPRIGGRQRIRARYAADIHDSVAAPVHKQQPISPSPRQQGGKKRGRPRGFGGGYSSETSTTTMSTTTMDISSTDIEDIGRDRYGNDDDDDDDDGENFTSIYADGFQALHWKRRQKMETLEQQRLRAGASTLSLDGLMATVRRRARSEGLQRAIGTQPDADVVADRERLDSAWKKRYEALLEWRKKQAEEEEEEEKKKRSEEKQQQREERKKKNSNKGHWREKKSVKEEEEEEEEEAKPRVVKEEEANGENQLLMEELEEKKEEKQTDQIEDEELKEHKEEQQQEEEEQQDAECQRLLKLGEQLNSIHHAIAVTTADGSASVVLEDKALELALDILNLSAAAAAAAAAAAGSSSSSSSTSMLRGSIPGLTPPSILEEIMPEAKRQYRALSKLVHPDKCSHIQADSAMSTLGDALKVFEERASGRGGAGGTCPSVIASCPQLVLKESEDKKDKIAASKGDGLSLEQRQQWVHTRDRLMIKVHILSPEIQNVLSTRNRRLGTAGCPQVLLDTEPALFLSIEDLPVLADANGATRHPPKPSSHQPKQGAEVEGLLFMTCRVALKGRFPLNGTYFQMNEVFVDNSTVVEPLVLPRNLVEKCATSHVHLGLSVHFMVKGMTRESVTGMFSSDYVCFRAFEPSTGVPRPLPSYLCPTTVKNAKSNWKNSSERAVEKLAKLTKQGVITETAAANISVAPPMPPVRYVRPLMGEETVQMVPQVLRSGESRSRFQFEETYFASQPRYGSALPVMMDGNGGRGRGRGSGRGRGRGRGGGYGPLTPGKRGRPPGSVNGQKQQKKNAGGTTSDNDDGNDDDGGGGGGGRSRVDRFPKMSRSSRCGECHTCLNPQMKKACLTRRAEMGEEVPFVKRRWS